MGPKGPARAKGVYPRCLNLNPSSGLGVSSIGSLGPVPSWPWPGPVQALALTPAWSWPGPAACPGPNPVPALARNPGHHAENAQWNFGSPPNPNFIAEFQRRNYRLNDDSIDETGFIDDSTAEKTFHRRPGNSAVEKVSTTIPPPKQVPSTIPLPKKFPRRGWSGRLRRTRWEGP